MIPRAIWPRLTALALVASFASADLLACSVCFGQSDDAMARGMNMGIFTLLLVITCVLFTIAGFFVYLIRRSSQMAESQPQPGTLSENQPTFDRS